MYFSSSTCNTAPSPNTQVNVDLVGWLWGAGHNILWSRELQLVSSALSRPPPSYTSGETLILTSKISLSLRHNKLCSCEIHFGLFLSSLFTCACLSLPVAIDFSFVIGGRELLHWSGKNPEIHIHSFFPSGCESEPSWGQFHVNKY